MHTELEQRFKELFEDALSYRFSKKEYENTFKSAYEKYKDLLKEIAVVCGESEENIVEFAAILPSMLEEKLYVTTSKRKKEIIQMEYNMAIAIYVIPLLDYNKEPALDSLILPLIEQWNAVGTGKMPISRGSFEEIVSKFKRSLCYITTAVCDNVQAKDNCYELNLLRNYRDHYLLSETNGEKLIEEYYDIAPTIVKRIGEDEEAQIVYTHLWNTYLKPCVAYIEKNDNQACKTLYTKMVRELQHKYITKVS